MNIRFVIAKNGDTITQYKSTNGQKAPAHVLFNTLHFTSLSGNDQACNSSHVDTINAAITGLSNTITITIANKMLIQYVLKAKYAIEPAITPNKTETMNKITFGINCSSFNVFS